MFNHLNDCSCESFLSWFRRSLFFHPQKQCTVYNGNFFRNVQIYAAPNCFFLFYFSSDWFTDVTRATLGTLLLIRNTKNNSQPRIQRISDNENSTVKIIIMKLKT